MQNDLFLLSHLIPTGMSSNVFEDVRYSDSDHVSIKNLGRAVGALLKGTLAVLLHLYLKKVTQTID